MPQDGDIRVNPETNVEEVFFGGQWRPKQQDTLRPQPEMSELERLQSIQGKLRERQNQNDLMNNISRGAERLGSGLAGVEYKPSSTPSFGSKRLDSDANRNQGLIDKYLSTKPKKDELALYEGKKKIDQQYDKPKDNKDVTAQHTAFKKSYGNNKVVKDFRAIRSAYGKMKNLSAKTPEKLTGSDTIAMVFSYMKALDPTSTVREGEYATASNSGGVSEKVRNFVNKILDGKVISKSVMQQMLGTVKSIVRGQQTEYKRYTKEQYRYAKETWGDDVAKRIFGELKYDDYSDKGSTPPAEKAPPSKKEPAKGIHLRGKPVTNQSGEAVLSIDDIKNAPDGTIFIVGGKKKYKYSTSDGKWTLKSKQQVSVGDKKPSGPAPTV